MAVQGGVVAPFVAGNKRGAGDESKEASRGKPSGAQRGKLGDQRIGDNRWTAVHPRAQKRFVPAACLRKISLEGHPLVLVLFIHASGGGRG